jgi:hypothetical protein
MEEVDPKNETVQDRYRIGMDQDSIYHEHQASDGIDDPQAHKRRHHERNADQHRTQIPDHLEPKLCVQSYVSLPSKQTTSGTISYTEGGVIIQT